MSAVYAPGVLPRPGDQVHITRSVAPTAVAEGVLSVAWTEPCDTDGWAYLVGRWPDGRPGRAMVWIDRIVVRRSNHATPTGRKVDSLPAPGAS
ncbi:hypothetical protein [Actinocatenispora comari]|uniref:Uncharacterized protein n=1 Tax=Actinocatenispora comari TaxID=2807577 RepID=A0A8J4ACU2_9ACTN|nr:hypothetical protein [Actinocatenispora comari]GIL28951.1 hypothetical protein NUM_42050 [Actinocatenispora comari]